MGDAKPSAPWLILPFKLLLNSLLIDSGNRRFHRVGRAAWIRLQALRRFTGVPRHLGGSHLIEPVVGNFPGSATPIH